VEIFEGSGRLGAGNNTFCRFMGAEQAKQGWLVWDGRGQLIGNVPRNSFLQLDFLDHVEGWFSSSPG